jgi:cell division protease FtsH
MPELEEAIDRTVAGLERKSRVMSDKEKERVAVHEMGHAIVALTAPTADPVHRVSIIPRGAAALGMTMQRPLQDRYLLTEPELKDRLAILLGGRTAEELVFDMVVSTGAQNDLERATEISRAMVTEYGMVRRLARVVRRQRVSRRRGAALLQARQQALRRAGSCRRRGDRPAGQRGA